MDISCPVSRKFPHGTLHYQSRSFFSFLVGGSTFFNPYFMYEFTRKQGNPSVRVVCSSFNTLLSSSFPPSLFECEKIPSFCYFHLDCFPSFTDSNLCNKYTTSLPNFARHYFRTLCWFLLIGTKMFQFPIFYPFFSDAFACMEPSTSFDSRLSDAFILLILAYRSV